MLESLLPYLGLLGLFLETEAVVSYFDTVLTRGETTERELATNKKRDALSSDSPVNFPPLSLSYVFG